MICGTYVRATNSQLLNVYVALRAGLAAEFTALPVLCVCEMGREQEEDRPVGSVS